jgi:UDPglucose 6-dehydrogenase
LLKELFSFFTFREERMFAMSIASAELTKYAANAMLATRISFMNELARFCERVGADVTEVRRGMGSDGRIGSAFLYAGVGYGGSCFPKDVKALVHSGREAATPFSILEAVEAVNDGQRGWFFEKILRHYGGKLGGKDFALWGLSFKPNTDDVREAPALDLICRLLEAGASVRAYDPVAEENARRTLASCPAVEGALAEGRLRFGPDNYEVLQGADALVLLTEWPLFRKPDWERMKDLMISPMIFDGRNQYNKAKLQQAGFSCISIGSKPCLLPQCQTPGVEEQQ